MIKEMLGEYDVGIYSAAVRLSEAFYFIPMLVSASLFPAILNAKKQNKALYKHRLQRLYTLMVWLSLSIVVPVVLFSNWLIIMVFGSAYQAAGQVLMIHISASIFVFLGVASSKWFIAENEQPLSFWRTFSGMMLNVLLNFYLIPKHGLEGAAFATLISQSMAAYFFDIFNHKTREMFFMKTKSLTSFDLLITRR
jgi:O-antigen/teichoic acid export membrane protein